jgi:hypothetical protein
MEIKALEFSSFHIHCRQTPSFPEKVDRLLFCKKEYYTLKYNVVLKKYKLEESMMSYHDILVAMNFRMVAYI